MSMKTINKYVLGLAVALSLAGCKDKMVELNTNPGTIGTTSPEYMFPAATMDWDYGRGMIIDKFASMVAMQYMVHNDYGNYPYSDATGISTANLGVTQAYWGQFYGHGNKLVSIINFIDKNLQGEQQAIYKDLRSICAGWYAYQAWRLFENFGAAVYSEAFKAQEGVLKPKYDMGQDQYRGIDEALKEAAAKLREPMIPGTVNIAAYDYFCGIVPGAKNSIRNDYTAIRANWAALFSSLRVKIAWKMKAADPAFYASVVNDVKATDVLQGPDQSVFYNYDGSQEGGSSTNNSDDATMIQFDYSMSTPFIDQLKRTEDPRLPLLARTNYVDTMRFTNYTEAVTLSTSYRWMTSYFPDSLVSQNGVSWGETFKRANYFQGMEPSNYRKGQFNAGQIKKSWGYSWKINNPNYPTPLARANMMKDGNPMENVLWGKDTSVTVRTASMPQGRYLQKAGGKSMGSGGSGQNGYDGPAPEYDIQLRRQVFTYTDQCFMFAWLAADGAGSFLGNSAAAWYEAGVKSAFDQIRQDAQRYRIQVAYNTAAQKLEGINDKGLYTITDDMIDQYLAKNPYSGKESVVAQAWIYLCYSPEEMWATWWRITGLPATIYIPMEMSAKPAYAKNNAYFAQPSEQITGDNAQIFPRRNIMPAPNVLNQDNYEETKAKLLATPGFGTWDYCAGRIWWDKNPQIYK